MKFFDDEKIKYIIFSVIIILELVIIGLEVICYECKDTEEVIVDEVTKVEKVEEVIINENIKIKVDIKGAVKKPGVYELDNKSRISDVIELAGGLKSNASTKYLNLSKKITDEMVIKVYTESQIKNMNIVYDVKEECICPTPDITSCAGSSIIESDNSNDVPSDSGTDIKIEDKVDSKISLNSGTKEELMTLSGVGESKANAIIEYRTKNGGFKSIDEIKNVSGIGESLYNKIKDNIKL